jgi:hypothetical protein
MTGGQARFSPDELPIDPGRITASDVAASIAAARELESLALAQAPVPSAGFVGRVMTAVAAEPAPQPVAVFARALAGGRLVGMLGAIRDAWRVSTSPGRPAPVRAQALALVLLVVLALGSVAGVAGAAVGLFETRRPSPPPEPTRPAIAAPTPSARPAAQVTPSPSLRSSAPPNAAATPSPTPRPTARPTPRRTATPEPTESEDPSGTDGDHRDADDTPSPGDTSSPSDNSGPG